MASRTSFESSSRPNEPLFTALPDAGPLPVQLHEGVLAEALPQQAKALPGVLNGNLAPIINTPFTLSFATKVDYATGSIPRAVTAADLNGDSYLDLIVANAYGDSASVLISAGDGTYAAKVDYATADYPISVVSVDVNGDGKADVITANLYDGVSVLLNKGDGTLASRVDYGTGSNPYSVVSADVNGDGKPDLVTANLYGNSVSVLTNNGNGTFAARVDYATGTNPVCVTSADVNGDGQPDLIATNAYSNTISVLINNGSGSFAAKVDYATQTQPYFVTGADINGDGTTDLVVVNSVSDTVSVFANPGTGVFAARADYPTGDNPFSVAVADVNADGRGDLIVANADSSTVSVLINSGNGLFAPKVDYATSPGPNSVISIDANGDGKNDVIAANSTSSMVSVLINKGSGVVTAFTEQNPLAVSSSLSLSDPNGDADWNTGRLSVQVTANSQASDSLSLPSANPGGSAIWLDATGNLLMAGGTQIGTADASGVSNGTAWTFTFNENATNALAQDTARAVQFNNSSDAPDLLSRTVTFTATDSGGLAASANQTVTVTAVNDVPVTTPVTLSALAEDGGTRLITQAALLVNASDVDGDGLSAMDLAINVGGGTLIDNGDGSWNYTPAHNDDSGVSFSYSISDGSASVEGSATLDLTPVNDAPIAISDIVGTTRNTTALFSAAQLLGNDRDVDGDSLHIASVTSGVGGTAVLNANGTVSFTPANNFKGAASFSYTASDGNAISNIAGVTVNVASGTNAPPVLAHPLADQSALQGALFGFAIPQGAFTDPNGDRLRYTASMADGDALPDWLQFIRGTGRFVGTPGSSDVGDFDVRVVAMDTGGLIADDVFSIHVAAAFVNRSGISDDDAVDQARSDASAFGSGMYDNPHAMLSGAVWSMGPLVELAPLMLSSDLFGFS